MRIETARSVHRYRDQAEQLAWLRGLAERKGLSPAAVRLPTDVAGGAAPAVAYVNHGRWVAECPAGCGGAMLMEPGEPFLCGECFNAALDGRWRPVRWPVQRAAIEVLLAKRPYPRHANWTPGETVADLRRENAAWGVK